MGIIGSIITSVIILVIALVIVEFIFYPYSFNGLKTSLSNAVSSLVNSAQTASAKAALATQSNKPILYIVENDNNSIELFDMQYNKIIGYISLNGVTPNNFGIGTNNKLYVTGSYYNYHDPQYHGVIAIVNTSNDQLIGTIFMASVPTQIALSINGTYAYTINNNGSLSEINLMTRTISVTLPENVTLNLAPPNPTANCTYSQGSSNITESCKGSSGLVGAVSRWSVSIFNESSLISGGNVLNRTYNSASFADNYTFPNAPHYTEPIYITTVTAYTNNSTFRYRFNYTPYGGPGLVAQNNKVALTAQPLDIFYSLNGTRLYIIANYSYSCSYAGFCYNETVYVLNPVNNRILKRIVLDIYPDYSLQAAALSIDGNKLYLLGGNGTNNYETLYLLNSSTESITNEITINSYTADRSSISLSPAGDYLYVISNNDRGSGNINVINTSTLSIVDSILTGASGSNVGNNQLFYFMPTGVAVASNYTYVIGTDGGGSYQLLLISRENDSITQSTGINGCPCEIITGN